MSGEVHGARQHQSGNVHAVGFPSRPGRGRSPRCRQHSARVESTNRKNVAARGSRSVLYASDVPVVIVEAMGNHAYGRSGVDALGPSSLPLADDDDDRWWSDDSALGPKLHAAAVLYPTASLSRSRRQPILFEKEDRRSDTHDRLNVPAICRRVVRKYRRDNYIRRPGSYLHLELPIPSGPRWDPQQRRGRLREASRPRLGPDFEHERKRGRTESVGSSPGDPPRSDCRLGVPPGARRTPPQEARQ